MNLNGKNGCSSFTFSTVALIQTSNTYYEKSHCAFNKGLVLEDEVSLFYLNKNVRFKPIFSFLISSAFWLKIILFKYNLFKKFTPIGSKRQSHRMVLNELIAYIFCYHRCQASGSLPTRKNFLFFNL